MNRSMTSTLSHVSHLSHLWRLWRAAALALAAGLCTAAWADDEASLRSGAMWQWAFSIPTPVNPMIDATGQNCMVGQSGSTWFLPSALGGGNAARSCTVPEGVKLVVAVGGALYVNTPGTCGDPPAALSAADMRAAISGFVDSFTQVSATLNGVPLRSVRRVRSKVYPVALPADNVFGNFCPAPGVPAGVYRTLDDGYVVEIEHLRPGTHTLSAGASNGSTFSTNVVYTITVVPRGKP